jgi:hypothetical protein
MSWKTRRPANDENRMFIGNPIRIGEPYQRIWEFTGGSQAAR